jgi:hypothetical protein
LASALAAALAFESAGVSTRRALGHGFGALGLAEIGLAFATIGYQAWRPEAWVSVVASVVLCAGWVRFALRRQEKLAVDGAGLSLLVGYGAARAQGLGPTGVCAGDAVAALVAAALCMCLVRSRRFAIFHSVARDSAFALPVAGLWAIPRNHPILAAALLLLDGALYAALAVAGAHRRIATLLSMAAFNAAVVVVWLGTGFGELVYFVIPAGVSALVLIRVFRKELSARTAALLRAFSVTAIYASTAWRALAFEQIWPMLVCVTACLIGIMGGIAFRIRSYVFLGTGFLVTCVLSNVVQVGLQDHRVGAIFLSVLGLGVVAFMVLWTAHRTELVRRYQWLQAELGHWEA